MANTAGKIDLAKQVFFDNFIHYTFVYFPVFYIFKESIQSGKGEDRGPTEIVTTAVNKYIGNFWTDNIAIWALWIPMDTLIYAAPIWMRLPLNHGVSFAWTVFLSFLRGDEVKKTEIEV
jgi:hypothetical protein